MNKFIRIEDGLAYFTAGLRVNESECKKIIDTFQTALEAFRVEKLWGIIRGLDTVGIVHKRGDGSYFVRIPGQPVIFTPNSAGDCFVEQGEKHVVIGLDEPLEVLVSQVKEFLKPEVQYRYLERNKDTIQEGDEVRIFEEWLPFQPRAFGKTPVLIARRPLLPRSITSKNFTLSVPKHFLGSHYTVLQ